MIKDLIYAAVNLAVSDAANYTIDFILKVQFHRKFNNAIELAVHDGVNLPVRLAVHIAVWKTLEMGTYPYE